MPEVFDLILQDDPLGQLIDPQQTYVVGQIMENVPIVVDVPVVVKTCGENINSHTPIAIINNLAYKLDATNVNHAFAFVGFSLISGITGSNISIQQIGEIELVGWGLTANKQYLAAESGNISITTNASCFTKVIGFSTSTTKMQIIKDYDTILNS